MSFSSRKGMLVVIFISFPMMFSVPYGDCLTLLFLQAVSSKNINAHSMYANHSFILLRDAMLNGNRFIGNE